MGRLGTAQATPDGGDINAYAWPTSEPDAAETRAESHGYRTVRWRAGGVEHWVVSDLNAAELAQFAALLRRP